MVSQYHQVDMVLLSEFFQIANTTLQQYQFALQAPYQLTSASGHIGKNPADRGLIRISGLTLVGCTIICNVKLVAFYFEIVFHCSHSYLLLDHSSGKSNSHSMNRSVNSITTTSGATISTYEISYSTPLPVFLTHKNVAVLK